MIGVIGAGAFGAALAIVQARAGRPVTLWGRSATARSASRPFPVAAHSNLRITDNLADLDGATLLLLVLPAQVTADFLTHHGSALPPVPLILCAKGIDSTGFRLQSQIVSDALPGRALAVLTGPGFAAEITRDLPTALTLACADAALGRSLQTTLSTLQLRLYLSDDIVGAQLGGALKNVTAIGCGMVEGAGLGHSARAALMTRGFAELTRLAAALGARAETLAGLSGLGDLSLTCNSAQSRNFALGRELAAGRSAPGGTVEGVATARAACQLAAQYQVDLPITAAVADVLAGNLSVSGAMDALLARPLKEE